MSEPRADLLFFAIDDLRESITQTLIPFPQLVGRFVSNFSDLLAQLDDNTPTCIICRPAARYGMPVGIPLVLVCSPDEYEIEQFVNEPAITDLVRDNELRRLPFIAQRELRQQRMAGREMRRLRAMVEQAPHGVIEAEVGSRQVRWSNPFMNLLFGYTATEMMTLLVEDLHPAEAHAVIIEAFERMSAGDKTPLLNVVCRRRDGSTFYCNIAPGGRYGNDQHLIFFFFTDVTAEYQSLQTLQINARRLELALRSANQGLYDLDVRSGETIVNAEYATMLGFDPASFIETTQSWRERLHPSDEPVVSQIYADYMAGKLPEYRVEYRSRMQQGGWKWILSVGAIVERDEVGNPVRMLGTHTDISALKRLELRERLRVQLFTSLLGGESLPALMNTLIAAFEDEQPDTRCAIVLFDTATQRPGRVIAPNLSSALVSLLEQSDSTDEASIWKPLFDRQRIVTPNLNAEPGWMEYAAIAQDSGFTTCWAEPIQGAGGAVIGAFTVWSARGAAPQSEDAALLQFVSHLAGPVIEQHLIAERLRVSEERYTLAERAVQDGVWDWDIINGVTYLSPQWKAMFGFGADELPNTITTFFERIHPDDWPAVTKAIDRHFAGLEPFNMEFRMRYRDDRYRWILARGEALRDADGKVTRMVGALSDITERKQLDERIRETQKLEALGLLTGGLAHDFNNLLGIIIGNLDLSLTDWQGDESARSLVEAALKAALRGAELTRSLLAVARRQPLAPTTIDVALVLQEFLPLIQVTIGSAIKVELIAQTNRPARADRAGLEAALLNLVINSRDAMPQGGKLTIKIREIQVTSEDILLLAILPVGCYIVIDVVDTGSGMSPEVAERAFEPFFTTKERGRGTGLGLPMVYGFARQSGGTAQIYSTSHLGTTVRLYLPCAAQIADEPAVSPAPTVRRDARILVVDDDPDLLRMTVATLINLGYTVSSAQDGRAALSILQAERFDLLITDVVMPEMNGQELATAALQIAPTIKVLYMSGFAALQGKDLSDAPLIEKPFRASALEVAVQQALER
ncbi:PAS domain-containing protein [uncultured Chloroflexus sp.]|uniref:PAS domain-containing protein n=1 Tax=uncultured Chloroflexus sp. TaxID=214040 RepID=UPI00260B40C6|nr:PAS domain-containing protein [uncultured Chloroflexus sp.]